MLAIFLESDVGGDGRETDAGHGRVFTKILQERLSDGGAEERFNFSAVLLNIIAELADGQAGAELGAERRQKFDAAII